MMKKIVSLTVSLAMLVAMFCLCGITAAADSDTKLHKGDTVTYTVKIKDLDLVGGISGKLTFNQDALEFDSYAREHRDGIMMANGDSYPILWNEIFDVEGTSFAEEPIASFTFKVKSDAWLSQLNLDPGVWELFDVDLEDIDPNGHITSEIKVNGSVVSSDPPSTSSNSAAGSDSSKGSESGKSNSSGSNSSSKSSSGSNSNAGKSSSSTGSSKNTGSDDKKSASSTGSSKVSSSKTSGEGSSKAESLMSGSNSSKSNSSAKSAASNRSANVSDTSSLTAATAEQANADISQDKTSSNDSKGESAEGSLNTAGIIAVVVVVIILAGAACAVVISKKNFGK